MAGIIHLSQLDGQIGEGVETAWADVTAIDALFRLCPVVAPEITTNGWAGEGDTWPGHADIARIFHDDPDDDVVLSVWARPYPLPWYSSGLAPTPYDDDDLGLVANNGVWGPRTPRLRHDGWREPRTFTQPSATLMHIPLPETASITKLTQECLEEVMLFVVGDDDRIPLGEYFTNGRGREILGDLYSLLRTGPWLYASLMNMPRIWGIVIAAAQTTDAWNHVRPRVRYAPLRLVYRDSVDSRLLDNELMHAGGIYVGSDCSLGNFTPVLGGSNLPHLRMLFIQPDVRGIPTGAQPSATQHLNASALNTCEVYVPLIVHGPVRRLGCTFYTGDQIRDILRPLSTLLRLDIGNIVGEEVLDLTSLLREAGSVAHLTFLRIRCGASQSAALNTIGNRLVMKDLKTLDVGGAVWVNAPSTTFARVFNVHAHEALAMAKLMPLLERLHLRWRLPLDDFPVFETLHLGALTELYLAGDMSEETETFLSHLDAPAIRTLQLSCDMRATANPELLPSIADNILVALQTLGGDPEGTRASLADAQSDLDNAGYGDISARMDDAVIPPLEHPAGGDEFPNMVALRACALRTLHDINIAKDTPKAPHAGFLLERVVKSALRLARLPATGIDISIENDGRSLDLRAHARDNTYRMRFSMHFVPSTFLAPGTLRHRYTRAGDSVTYGLARMLFGFAAFNPVHVHVKGDPIFQHTLVDGGADVRELRRVLLRFDSVQNLHMDFSKQRAASKFLSLLGDGNLFPRLQHLLVTAPSYHDQFETIWTTLEDVIADRDAAGHRLPLLVIKGRLCVAEAYAGRLENAVGCLRLHTRCGRTDSMAAVMLEECQVCRWRGPM
ncbi:unnamed protein product [Peniophora sp. CBMAI 1063]|nr:unnamed protein product [Peniophora sp. CBMAI 1063]